MKKILISLVVIVLALPIIGGAGVYVGQESLIFNFAPVSQDHDYEFPKPHEEIWLENGGAKLHGVFYPTQQSRQGVILYFKGNAGNIGYSPKMAQTFLSRGFDFIAMDYRGFGKSTGELSEANLLSDASLWYDYAKTRFPDDDLRVVGYSLGTTFASHLAGTESINQTLLFAPMKSILDMGKRRYPFLPDFLSRYPFRSDLKIKKAGGEVLVFHGTDDRIVPHASGIELEQSFNGDDSFYTIEGANHFDLPWRTDVLEILDREWDLSAS
jgi:pimeloyl-ACP methyl ester carboxylesterase